MKKTTKQKRLHRANNDSPLNSIAGEKNETKNPLLVKITRGNLEETIRQQTGDLKMKNGLLKQGADREKLADAQINIQTKAMEAVSEGIFIIDANKPDFPIIYANSAFERFFAYTKNEVIGKNYFSLYGSNTDLSLIARIKQTLIQKKHFYGEILNFRNDNKKLWSLLRIAPVRDADGIVTHYVGVQTDLTLMKEKELEIDDQREELLHVTRVGKLAEFVSSLAHEISQPLTAILSYAQAIQRMLNGREPQINEIIQYIVNDDLRATEVIRRLRSLLKKSKPVFELLDINVIIRETAVLMATDITVRNKVLKTELDTNLPLIRGDRIQLQQVILNLISNSLDAMEAYDDLRELAIRTSRKNQNSILVEVKDSGCGIPDKNMEKLFHHFFTSKPDGLGMGLAISRSIIEAHGGQLDVKNNPDRGATFYFTLPVDKKDV